MVELSRRHSQGCAAACWIVTPRSFRPTHFRGEEGLTPSPLGSTGEVISSYIRQRAAQSVDFDWWWFQCLVLERVEVKVGGGIVVASRAAQAVVFWTLPTGGLGVTRRQPPGLFWGGGGPTGSCRTALPFCCRWAEPFSSVSGVQEQPQLGGGDQVDDRSLQDADGLRGWGSWNQIELGLVQDR